MTSPKAEQWEVVAWEVTNAKALLYPYDQWVPDAHGQQTLSEAAEDASKYRLAYNQYICSSKWERRRMAYFAKHPKTCRACGGKEQIHLHHHTYKRMGHELDSDLVPLCQSCHDLVHKHHRAHPGWSLTRATSDFLRIAGSSLRPGKRKAKRRRTTRSVVKECLTPLTVGERVVIVGDTQPLSWATGKGGVVRASISQTSWWVEVDGHPGSRLGVTLKTARRISGGRNDPVNDSLGKIRQRRRTLKPS